MIKEKYVWCCYSWCLSTLPLFLVRVHCTTVGNLETSTYIVIQGTIKLNDFNVYYERNSLLVYICCTFCNGMQYMYVYNINNEFNIVQFYYLKLNPEKRRRQKRPNSCGHVRNFLIPRRTPEKKINLRTPTKN